MREELELKKGLGRPETLKETGRMSSKRSVHYEGGGGEPYVEIEREKKGVRGNIDLSAKIVLAE